MEVSNKRGDVNGYYRIVQQIRIKEVQPFTYEIPDNGRNSFLWQKHAGSHGHDGSL